MTRSDPPPILCRDVRDFAGFCGILRDLAGFSGFDFKPTQRASNDFIWVVWALYSKKTVFPHVSKFFDHVSLIFFYVLKVIELI